MSTPQDKKAHKKLQNVFSSVSYRSTTAPNHELEGSVCLFGLKKVFFAPFYRRGLIWSSNWGRPALTHPKFWQYLFREKIAEPINRVNSHAKANITCDYSVSPCSRISLCGYKQRRYTRVLCQVPVRLRVAAPNILPSRYTFKNGSIFVRIKYSRWGA